MSTPSFDVRRLGPGDVALVRALNAMFGAAFGDRETYGGDPPTDAYLDELLAKDDVFALAAIRAGAVIGGLVAYELPKFERRRSEVYIYDLAVDEASRRTGVATALIERLKLIARERGVWAIYVQADHGDDAAIALYAKLGVREDVMHFDLTVSPEER